MDFNEIKKDLIEDFSMNFKEILNKNQTKLPYKEEELMDYGIFCNRWVEETIEVLIGNDSNADHQTCEELSDKILLYLDKLCKEVEPQKKTLEIINQLDYYPPRPEFLESSVNIDNLLKRTFSKIFESNQTLKKEKYFTYFEILLELEDLETLRDYYPFVQHDVYLQEDEHSEYTFNFNLNEHTPDSIETVVIPNIDEVVIIKQDIKKLVNEEFFIQSLILEECQILKATVTKISKTSITFEFDDTRGHCPVINTMKPVTIIVRPQRQLVRYQHRALSLFQENFNLQRYLFPEKNCVLGNTNEILTSFKLINENIAKNPEQLEAVQTIVAGPNPAAPYIIFGPPGTGKTTTIVESILQLRLQKPDTRILVTAGSNAACDTLAIRLCEHFEKSPLMRKHLEKTCIFPMIRIFSKDKCHQKKVLPKHLVFRSNLKWIKKRHAYPCVGDIHKYGIIITTLCLVGKLNCADVNGYDHFTHIFIDEAGASSEPEALIAISGIKNKIGPQSCHVILSGDHKQLGPVIKSDQAEKYGLGKSLMERLLEFKCYNMDSNGIYDRTLQMRLRRNYRSHPEIVQLYNHLYYNNELIPMLSKNVPTTGIHRNWSFVPNSEFPIIFQAINGEMTKENTKSSCNKLEIENVINLIWHLMKYDSIKQTDIGIITPYKLQVKLIKIELEERDWKEIEVGTVEHFQGREKLIIIASMVRSNRMLGFVRCPRRLNVLLSRPIALLIILGDPVTLNRSKDFQFIINQCKSNGNFGHNFKLDLCKNNFISKKCNNDLGASNFPILGNLKKQQSINAKKQNCDLKKEKNIPNYSFEQWTLMRSEIKSKPEVSVKKSNKNNSESKEINENLSLSNFPLLGNSKIQKSNNAKQQNFDFKKEKDKLNESFENWTILRSRGKALPDISNDQKSKK